MDALKHKTHTNKSCLGHQRRTCASGDPEPVKHQGAFVAWKRLDKRLAPRTEPASE